MTDEKSFKDIIYQSDWHERTALVTINRPKDQNSYTLGTLKELIKAFDDAMFDDDVQFIVLTGAGEKAFCTGGNVDEYALNYGRKPNDWWKWGEFYGRFMGIIMHCGKPVISRINGTVAGGGLEFVAAGDLAIATDDARVLSPGPRVGMTSVGGLSQWIPLHSGIKRTAELVMLSSEITAKKAVEWGIINEAVPRANLDAKVKEYIERMLDLSPTSLHYFKVHLNWWKDIVWAGTWEHAKEFFSLNIGSIEPMEGLNAFMEKRPRKYREIRQKMAKGLEPRYPFGPCSSKCKSCGAEYLPLNAQFCLQCGAKMATPGK